MDGITWQSPQKDDTFSQGGVIEVKWKAPEGVASRYFRLCTEQESANDAESNSSCGSPVSPEVQRSRGSYIASLTLPNVTEDTSFCLQMEDSSGVTVSSPSFLVTYATAQPADTSESPTAAPSAQISDTASIPTDPVPSTHATLSESTMAPNSTTSSITTATVSTATTNMLATRQPPPVAAYTVPLIVVFAIIITAAALSLRHRRKLEHERKTDQEKLNLSRVSSLTSYKSTSDVDHALNILAKADTTSHRASPTSEHVYVNTREPRRSTRQAYSPPSYISSRSSICLTPSNNFHIGGPSPSTIMRTHPFLPAIYTSPQGFMDESLLARNESLLTTHTVPCSTSFPGPVSTPPRLYVRQEGPRSVPEVNSCSVIDSEGRDLQNPYDIITSRLKAGISHRQA